MRFTSRVLALRRAEGVRRTRTVSIDWNGVTFDGLLWYCSRWVSGTLAYLLKREAPILGWWSGVVAVALMNYLSKHGMFYTGSDETDFAPIEDEENI